MWLSLVICCCFYWISLKFICRLIYHEYQISTVLSSAWLYFSPFSSVQSLSHVWLFATPWSAAGQVSLSITNSRSLLKFMSIESVMPSNHFIFCHHLSFLSSIIPRIRVFSNESVLCIRWWKYWSFGFSISPSSEYSGLNLIIGIKLLGKLT